MFGATGASAATPILVHREPGCGCCGKWAEQAREQFQRPVTMIDDRSRASFQRERGVPQQMSSCHTAVIDGLVFEGHVPIAAMKRLLAQRPRGVAGLSTTARREGQEWTSTCKRSSVPDKYNKNKTTSTTHVHK